MDYFHGKVTLITGSARGIGLAIARRLGRRGARIVLSDVLADVMWEARDRLRTEGIEAEAFPADVTSPADAQALVTAALDRFGRLDILINNAGVSIVAPFDTVKPEVAKKLVDVNVMGSVYMTMAALPAIKKSRGHIIFVASVSGLRAIPKGSLYSASKAFVRSFAESLRVELKPLGVHVGVISPGFTSSDPAKTVMKGDGSARPIDRPPHDTPEGVAAAVARLILRRERERVTTPLGRATALLQRLSPTLLDYLLARTELKD